MASEGHHQLHVFLFPLMAYGHMIPTVDIARLLAARGVKCTIITTFINTSVLTKIIERDQNSGLDIGIKELRFPTAEVGIPEGTDADSIDSPEMLAKFFMALNFLQEPLEKLLEEQNPDLIIADMFLPWANDVASKFKIPRLVFHGTSFFSLCVSESLKVHEPHIKTPAEQESFIVPGLPDQIEMMRSQMPDAGALSKPFFSQLMDQVRDSVLRSYGVVVNSFYELEPAYAEHYRKVMGRKAWHIGPVSLRNRHTIDKAQRGKKASVDEHFILNWLDPKNPNSVLYICFGSVSQISKAQLLEIAIGLENSRVSFVWVLRKSKKAEEESFLPEGFEERIEGKGLIIRDWAPQVLILDHQAIGGFMTHCGWNSALESISAGVPMITWPMFAEQFHNEKVLTQVLKIGIRVGAEQYNEPGTCDKEVAVKKEKVEEAVNQLMGDGEEAHEMRRKASEFKEMAKKAVDEGGSSYKDLTALIEELRIHRQTSTPKENQVKLDVSV